ncbi:translocation/assembly module TamB domain-containing protein [Oricola sp.]|uniref:translocation/assembly module TamB domain-containing protein n=1 Tax=Oricola sp. TaxID=1979950 RepID=UPI003BAA6FE2
MTKQALTTLAAAALTTGVLASAPADAQDNVAEERSALIRFVEDRLSTPNRQIRLNGIRGTLSSNVSLESITFADEDGVWLRIVEPKLVWQRTAILTGALNISSLTAERIDWPRMPVADESLPPPESANFSLPDFPVSVRLDEIRIGNAAFGEPVFGLETNLALDGRLALADGRLDTKLDIMRLDGPGGDMALDASYAQETNVVEIDFAISEPRDGVVANLLRIPERPPIELAVAGGGPVDQLQVDLSFDADRQRIATGELTVQRQGSADDIRASFDLAGPISNILPVQHRDFFGAETSLSANMTIAEDGVEVERMDVRSGAMQIAAQGAAYADGFLRRMSVDLDLSPAGEEAVRLPLAGDPTTVGGGKLTIDYDADAAGQWSLEGRVGDIKSNDAAIELVELAGGGGITDAQSAEDRAITFNLDVNLDGYRPADAGLAAAIGQTLALSAAGDWRSGRAIAVETMRIAAETFSAAAQGTLEELGFTGTATARVDDLGAFSQIAGQKLGGRSDISVDGEIDLIGGGFDVALDGMLASAMTEVPALNRILAGKTNLSGRVARTPEGLTFRQFELSNAQAEIGIDGRLASRAADLRLDALLSDLATLSPEGSGPLAASIAVEKVAADSDDTPYGVMATVTLDNGRLRGHSVTGLRAAFAGDVDRTNAVGALSGTGSIDGETLRLAATINRSSSSMRIADLSASVGPSRIVGDLTAGNGIYDGALSINSTDVSLLAALALTEASGAIDGDVSLAAVGERQDAVVRATGDRLSVAGYRIGNAEIDASLRDLRGVPQFVGEISARAFEGVGVRISELQATAEPSKGKGSQSGGAAPINWTVRATAVENASLSAAGIAPIDANGSGSFAGNSVRIAALELVNRQNLDLSGSGTLPLSGGGLSLRVDGSAPLQLAERLLAQRDTRLSGVARVNARVNGSLAEPEADGLFTLSGATVTDPLSNIRLTGLNAVAGLRGNTIAIRSAKGQLESGGSVSASGTVGLSGGMPASLRIAFQNSAYSDAQTVSARFSGDLAIDGPLAAGPIVSGSIDIDTAEVTIPESFGTTAELPDLRHVNPDASTLRTLRRLEAVLPRTNADGPSAPVRLDIALNAPSRVFVRGRGVDAELGGRVRLAGPLNALQPVGSFALIRGRILLLNKRLDLTRGQIAMTGSLDPLVELAAEVQEEDITAFVELSGRASDLELRLTSSPEFPEDEILARVLFGESIANLSPLQIANLATAAASLSGNDGGLAGQIRRGVGIDNLDFREDGEGGFAVRAGTYLRDNVYLDVQAGALGGEATINLDITDSLTARGTVETDGDSKLGVFFERDY